MSISKYQFILYNYWRSSASYRVRIALDLKEVSYEYRSINLLEGQQRLPEYKEINPSGLVPALIVTDDQGKSETIAQSVAIIEFIDDLVSTGPKLIPTDPFSKAKVMEIVNTLVADTHPIIVHFSNSKEYDEELKTKRCIEAVLKGFHTVETLLSRQDSTKTEWKYCVGNELTLADLILEPQIFVASRFPYGDLNKFPRIKAIHEHLSSLPAFIRAGPSNQPDYPKK